VLSSYVRQAATVLSLALQGPARAVFQRKLGSYENLTLEAALRDCESLLCGTSWQSDLELDAIALARRSGKPSVAWLDSLGKLSAAVSAFRRAVSTGRDLGQRRRRVRAGPRTPAGNPREPVGQPLF